MVNKIRTNHGMKRTIIKLKTQNLKHERWAVADVCGYFTVLCTLFVPQIYETWQNWHQSHNTEEYYFDLCCFVKMSETIQFFLNPWVKIDLSVCSTAKHGCSVTPLICSPEHTVYLFKRNKRVQIFKKNKESDYYYYYYTPHTREGFWSQSTTNSKQEIGK